MPVPAESAPAGVSMPVVAESTPADVSTPVPAESAAAKPGMRNSCMRASWLLVAGGSGRPCVLVWRSNSLQQQQQQQRRRRQLSEHRQGQPAEGLQVYDAVQYVIHTCDAASARAAAATATLLSMQFPILKLCTPLLFYLCVSRQLYLLLCGSPAARSSSSWRGPAAAPQRTARIATEFRQQHDVWSSVRHVALTRHRVGLHATPAAVHVCNIENMTVRT
jgi:hypothetical protein